MHTRAYKPFAFKRRLLNVWCKIISYRNWQCSSVPHTCCLHNSKRRKDYTLLINEDEKHTKNMICTNTLTKSKTEKERVSLDCTRKWESTDDRANIKKHTAPGTSCVRFKCEIYANQQTNGGTGRECTTARDQQDMEVPYCFNHFWKLQISALAVANNYNQAKGYPTSRSNVSITFHILIKKKKKVR